MNQTSYQAPSPISAVPSQPQGLGTAATYQTSQGQANHSAPVYSVQGSSAMAPAPAPTNPYPQGQTQGYQGNVVPFPAQPQAQQTPTAPPQSPPPQQPDYSPAMPPAAYQNPPQAQPPMVMGYQGQPQYNPGTQPSPQSQEGESVWKRAFEGLTNLLGTPVWGNNPNLQPPSQGLGQPYQVGQNSPNGINHPAQYQQAMQSGMPTSFGNQGYSQNSSPQLPEPGSVDAPLSNLQITDPSLPTDQELAAVGYSPSVLNAYSINLEDALLQQNEVMKDVGSRLQATEKVMTDPHILANYVVDYNQKVDSQFLERVADYYEQELAQSQQAQQQAYQQQYGQPVQTQMQGQPQQVQAQQPQVQGMQMPTPGVGMGMVTPEMLQTSEVVVPPQRYNQPLTMQQTGPSQLQQPYTGNAPVGPAPAMPAPAGQVSQDDLWANVRQAMAMNPATAWQTFSQLEAMYGPQALAKPLIRA